MFFLRVIDYSEVVKMKPVMFGHERTNKMTKQKINNNSNGNFYFSFLFKTRKMKTTKERVIFVFSRNKDMQCTQD